MADIEDVKKILKKGIRFGAAGLINSKQLEEVAAQLVNTTVNLEMLQQFGREMAADRLLFCEVDVDGLNKALNKPEKLKPVERNE